MNLNDLLQQVDLQSLGLQMMQNQEIDENNGNNQAIPQFPFPYNSLQSLIQQAGTMPTLDKVLLQQTNSESADNSPIPVQVMNFSDIGLQMIPVSPELAQQLGLQTIMEQMAEQMSFFNLDDYTIIKKIGEGGFGKVYLIRENNSDTILAAKVSLEEINEESNELLKDLSREVNIMSKLNHPCVLKYIGYSPLNFKKKEKPVIITEFASNGSLKDLLNSDFNELKIKWNDTHKLMMIYGIATAMSYLHLHDIIHRDLKPGNILIDEFWMPKVADFGLSKFAFSKKSLNNNNDSTLGLSKGTPLYMSPEIWLNGEYSKACDVYAFSLIVYEIITNEKPFDNLDFFSILNKIRKVERPNFNSPIHECWKNLIEKCWAQEPNDRPTFDEIVELLKNDDHFTENVDKEEFLNFIKKIDENEISYEKEKNIKVDKVFHLNDLIDISEDFQKNDKDSIFKVLDQISEIKICPIMIFFKLNDECKKLVEEAENDCQKQFFVARSFIEGRDYFPINTQLGIEYLKYSINNGCIDSVIYLFNMLNKGKIIPKNHKKAKKILDNYLKNNEALYSLLLGKLLKNKQKYLEAIELFKRSIELGNSIAMYEYGKILLNGEGQPIDEKKAIFYFKNAIENDCIKAMLKYGLILKNKDENNEEAIQYIKKSADKGYPKAMYYYHIILNDKGEDEEAYLYLKNAAFNGYTKAMYEYGSLMLNNNDMNSYLDSLRFLKKASEKGDMDSIRLYSTAPSIKGPLSYENNLQFKYNSAKNRTEIEWHKKEAIKYLKILADFGDIEAIKAYSMKLYNGDDIEQNVEEAVKYFKIGLEKGDTVSMYNYGIYLESNSENKEISIRYFKKAADKGYIKAINKLTNIYDNEERSSISKEEIVKYYKIGSEKGDADSMYNYGIYLNSIGKTDLELFKKSAEKGCVKAMVHLARIYDRGNGVPIDQKEAIKYYKMAADAGDANSMNNYAYLMQLGKCGPVDVVQIFEYYEKAIKKGHPGAMYNVAMMFEKGYGSTPDKRKALEYYKMSADHGDSDGMYKYARLLDTGDGVPIDKEEAMKYYKMAADKGEVKSMNCYAYMNDHGDGVPVRKREAVKYYKKAIENGNEKAMFNYALLLQTGAGVLVNKKDASKYYKMAADRGFSAAMNKYAIMLDDGDGVPINKQEALRYYRMAIDKGDVDEILRCAVLLDNGDGVQINHEEAIKYYQIAADNGDLQAKMILFKKKKEKA